MSTFLLVNILAFYLLLKTKLNINNHIPNRTYWCICLFLILIVAFRGPIDHDYGNYVSVLNNPKDFSISEPTFLLFRWIINTFSLPNVTLFIVYASCAILIKFIAIRKYSKLELVSLLVYFSNVLLLHEMNQIRAGIASALLLISLNFLYRKKYKYYIFIIFISTLFHYSSLGALCLLFLSRTNIKRRGNVIFWAILPISGVIFHLIGFSEIISLIPIEVIRIKLEMYKRLEEMGVDGFSQVNLFNPYFIFKLIIYYFLFYKRKYFIKYPQFSLYLKIFGLSLFLFHFLSVVTPLLGYRMSEYIGVVEIFLFPYCFLLFKTNEQKFMMISAYYFLLLSVNIFYKQLIFL